MYKNYILLFKKKWRAIAGAWFEQALPGHEPGVLPLHYPAAMRKTTAAISFISILILKPKYQLHVPVQLPCYDFVPVKNLPTQAAVILLQSKQNTLAHLKQTFFQTVTGGLYRTPEPVHRNLADLRLLAIPTLRYFKLQKAIRTEKTFVKKRSYSALFLISSL